MSKNVSTVATIIAVLVTLMLPIAQSAKVGLVVVVLGVLLYLKRGYVLVALASRAMNAKTPDEAKAWRLYEQGWKAGLAPKYTVMLANLFLQRGDAAVALRMLEALVEKERRRKKPDGNLIASALTSQSMALWVTGRTGEAIEVLQSVRSDGKGDKNLYINLGSYLLEKGRLAEAEKVILEGAKAMPETPGMLDNRAWLLLETGRLQEAERIFDTLIADSKPRFPEAFVHAAMVKVALGKFEKARELYREALDKPFYRTTGYSKESIQRSLQAIEGRPDDAAASRPSAVDTIDWFEAHQYDDEDLFDDERDPDTSLSEEEESDPDIELDEEDYRDNFPEVEEDSEHFDAYSDEDDEHVEEDSDLEKP